MIRKSLTQKNTLLKTAARQRYEPKFLREYFFLQLGKEFYFFSPTLQCFNLFSNRTLQTRKDIALNVNRLEQSVCEYGHDSFGHTAAHAGNIKLSEILKKGGLVVNQTVVLLMKCVQVQKMRTTLWQKLYLFVRIFCVNSCASYSPFFKTSPSPCALSAILTLRINIVLTSNDKNIKK